MTRLFIVILGLLISCLRQFERDTVGFGQREGTCLRGILVLLVIFHHLPACGPEFCRLVQAGCGRYAVGMFFFMSGYGLMTQYAERGREAVMQGFLVKRFTKLLLPLLVAEVVYYLWGGCQTSIHTVLENWRTGETLVPYAYFVEELALFYMLFYLAYRFCSCRVALVLCFLGTLGMMGTFIALGWNPHWWISSLVFPCGIAAVYMQEWMDDRRLPLFVIAAVLFAVAMLAGQGMPLEAKLARFSLLLCPLACLMVYLVWPVVCVPNPVVSFLGRISYEMYLLQGIAISLFADMLQSPLMTRRGPLLVCGCCALMATAAWAFNRLAVTAILQRIQPEEDQISRILNQ